MLVRDEASDARDERAEEILDCAEEIELRVEDSPGFEGMYAGGARMAETVSSPVGISVNADSNWASLR